MVEVTHTYSTPAHVRRWLKHFERVGTAAGIVARRGKFSVYRAGSGKKSMGSGHGIREHNDPPIGNCFESVHGFEELWLEAQEKRNRK